MSNSSATSDAPRGAANFGWPLTAGGARAPPPSSAPHLESLADADCERRIVVEEEGRDVVVVDEQRNVRLLLRKPVAQRRERREDRRPHRIAAPVPVERAADR